MPDSAISVVLATYNGQRHLAAQLESLKTQQLLPAELVLSDDGSTDQTLAIAAEFARSAPFPVRIQQNPSRLGYAANFLFALESTTNSLIAFCDQDDVWMPEKLAACAAHFSRPEVSLVVHNARVVDGDLKPLDRHTLPPGLTDRAGPLRLDPFLNPIGCSMVFRRSLFASFNWRSRPRNFMGDGTALMGHDQWIYFLSHALATTALEPRVLADYRQHSANTFGSATPQAASLAASLHTDVLTYAQRRDSCMAYAEYFLAQTRGPGAPADHDSIALGNAARYYRTLAHRLDARVQVLAAPSPVRKCWRILGLSLRGGYRSRLRGGLGFRALVKDSLRVVSPGVSAP